MPRCQLLDVDIRSHEHCMAFCVLAQVVVMRAQNLEAANPELLPAAQVELRAIHAGITICDGWTLMLRMGSCPHPNKTHPLQMRK